MTTRDYSHLSDDELQDLAMTDIDAAFEHMHRMHLQEIENMSDAELIKLANHDVDAAWELLRRERQLVSTIRTSTVILFFTY